MENPEYSAISDMKEFAATASNAIATHGGYVDRGGCSGGVCGSNYGRSNLSNTYMRSTMTFDEYEELVPQHAIPDNHHELLFLIQKYYKREGIIRNTIDLMTDFACVGVRVSHQNKGIQKFYRNWFARVKGADRSERFLNALYKFGVVAVQRRWGTLKKADRARIRSAKADLLDGPDIKKYRVPSSYVFLNPMFFTDIDGEKSITEGKPIRYGMIKQQVNDVVGVGTPTIVPIDVNDLVVSHYKKEDWQLWASPILESVMRDVYQLNLNKLADFTALQSACSPVRVWKLGNFEYKIAPNPEAMAKLRNALLENPVAGIRDIIWTPDIELLETQRTTTEVLGEDKYKPCLNAIYVGLGIPPTLSGSAIGSSGTTNNLVSLKTLIKRLEYGRQKLVEFWEAEFEYVRQAMGFTKAAELEFDIINLGDEEAEKKLWIELADRNLISDEWVQQKFGANHDIERARTKRDHKDRRARRIAPKGGAYHDPMFVDKIEKDLLLAGKLTPSQLGIYFDVPDGDEDFIGEFDGSPDEPIKKQSGRPKNSTDLTPRKKRRFVPKTVASLWAFDAMAKITEIVTPAVLACFAKKNARSLSTEEAEKLEQIKFSILCSTAPMSEINDGVIKNGVNNLNSKPYQIFSQEIKELEASIGRQLTLDEKRHLQLEFYLRAVTAEEEIDLKPTKGMAEEAQKGLNWRKEFGRGGTPVGVARANQLVNRENLTPKTIRRMVSFFARHEVDKKAEGFRAGEDGYPSNGRIAWALWGGDEGKTWANKKWRQIKKSKEK